MIDWKSYKIFTDNISNLKELSIDDSDKDNIHYMTDSLKEAVDFDTVKASYANDLDLSEECASSVDGIFKNSNNLVFVEFKNGNMKGEKRKVKDKIRDSLLIFGHITGVHIADTREWLEFVLVYNIEKNPMPNQVQRESVRESYSRVEIAKHFSKKAKEEFIRFGLERFKTLYFKEVHTYSEEEFEEYLQGCV